MPFGAVAGHAEPVERPGHADPAAAVGPAVAADTSGVACIVLKE